MNQEIKEKWVSALRSGEYKQTQCKLKSINGTYCCLGVLCDLYLKESNQDWKLDNRWRPYFNTLENKAEYDLLPLEVRVWAGISSINPEVYFPESSCMIDLTELNDDGHGFDEIANLIESSNEL